MFPAAPSRSGREIAPRCVATAACSTPPILRQFAEMFSRRFSREQLHVGIHHDSHKFVKSNFCFPAENFLRLSSVTKQKVHLGRPLVTRVVVYELLPIEIAVSEVGFDKLMDRVSLPG